MKFSAVVDSKSEMKYFQKLKRDKQLRYTKFVQILEKKEIRFYLERWRRVCAKILQGIRKTEFFIMRRALRGKLKILHLLKRNSELDKAKRGKILRASDFFYMKKCRTSVSHWKILIRSSQEKREKFALSILHWSTYKKWTIFNLYKAQVQYELRLRYLKAHAYHCYK